MSKRKMKEAMIGFIAKDDEEKIAKMQPWVKDDRVIGYTIDGEPIFAEEFKKEAEEILQRMEAGEYRTIQELKKEMRQW